MSIRTVIEINHDCLSRIGPEDVAALLSELGMSTFNAALNRGEIPQPCQGIRIICQRHHSEPATLVIAGPARRYRSF